jgi:hypothetical protein
MYRILTENKNFDAVLSLCGDCTAFSAIGVWHGVKEQSLVIDLSDRPVDEITAIADAIGKLNSQEAVMVQHIPSTDTLVYP